MQLFICSYIGTINELAFLIFGGLENDNLGFRVGLGIWVISLTSIGFLSNFKLLV